MNLNFEEGCPKIIVVWCLAGEWLLNYRAWSLSQGVRGVGNDIVKQLWALHSSYTDTGDQQQCKYLNIGATVTAPCLTSHQRFYLGWHFWSGRWQSGVTLIIFHFASKEIHKLFKGTSHITGLGGGTVHCPPSIMMSCCDRMKLYANFHLS